MCGRYAFAMSPEEVANIFEINEFLNFAANYNVTPTSMMPIIANGKGNIRRSLLARWGLLPEWLEKDLPSGPVFNARSETLEEKKMFSSAYKKHRCLIPADGFYEWKKQGNSKQPYFISRTDENCLAFGGLWVAKKNGENFDISFSIITTQSNEDFKDIHARFPLVVERENWVNWLDGNTDLEKITSLFVPPKMGVMKAHEVSNAVNKVSNNFPELMAQIG